MGIAFSSSLKGNQEMELNGADKNLRRKKNYNLLNKPNIISITD